MLRITHAGRRPLYLSIDSCFFRSSRGGLRSIRFVTPCLSRGWDQVTEYQLYFGRSDSGGVPNAVSDEEWAQFLNDTVTPRFPDGLTVTDGAGQWRNDAGEILKERAKVLTLLVWPDDTALQRLNEIAAEYERQFDQESVLLTSTQTCASFS